MVNGLNGIKNFLQLINDNWMLIVAIIGLIFGIYKKIEIYFHKSTEEKIDIVKEQISEAILKLITDAEFEYSDWVKAGQIKRSQVIKQIYSEFPILDKIQNQEELVDWIDEQIDDALDVLREIIQDNMIGNKQTSKEE